MEEQKLNILKEILGDSFRSGNEYLFYCPYCKHHKKKFSVNIKNGAKCWVCDTSTPNLRRVVRKFGNYNHLIEWDKYDGREDITEFDNLFAKEAPIQRQFLTLPDEFASLANRNLSLTSLPARKYLNKRGITREDIVRWKIGYCTSGEYTGRIIIPSFDEEGHLSYFIARSYDNSWKKYMNPPVPKDVIFNELYLDWQNDMVLTEGAFDAIVAGPNSVPVLGSTLREGSRLFQKIVKNDTPIYLAFDNDAHQKELRIIKKFLSYGVEIHKINTAGFQDVGEMTKEEFNKRKQKSVFINNDNYLLYQANFM